MRQFVALLLAGSATAFLAPRSETQAPYIVPRDEDIVAEHYIVKLRDDHNLEDHFTNIGLNVTEVATEFENWDLLNAYHFVIPEGNSHVVHDVIRRDPGVVRVTHNHNVSPERSADEYAQSGPPVGVVDEEYSRSRSRTKNLKARQDGCGEVPLDYDSETRKNTQWNLAMIAAGRKITEQLQGDIYKEDHQAEWLANAGKGVDIYIFDSGIRLSHKAFGGRASHFNGKKSNDKSPYCNTAKMDDDIGHGTHVAAIAASPDYGVAPAANIINVKVDCASTMAHIISSVLDVIKAHNNKKNAKASDFKGSVINVSMKWDMSNYANPIDFEEAWAKAADAGIAIAAAAGNENKKSIGVPARWKSVLSVGAVDVNYNRWAKSNYKGNMNIWAPGAGVKSAIHTSDTATEYLAGTSMATPHVSGVMALMIGWEGGCISSNARSVYERIEQNQIMSVTADQVIVDSGATTALLQTGINHQAKPANQPYAGIPGKKRSVAPRQEVKDGDADMWESFDDPVLECEGVEKEQRWVERNQLAEIIEKEFCPEASKQEFPDGRELFIGLSRFTRRYRENRPDAVSLSIQFPAGIYYPVNRESCIDIMRGKLLDTCDGRSSSNPVPFKAGGSYLAGGIKYRMDPLSVRTKASNGFKSGCKIEVGSGRRVISGVKIWGAGWAGHDNGATLDEKVGACGMVKNEGYWKFKYEMRDDREWIVEFIVDGSGAQGCIEDAIEKAGGPKPQCEVVQI
ncbi:hypothetical protein K4K54_000405 [Colletotrichum sp. SAR 10_86]|nr:hypothetical protein K4K51_001827 [Colletotrichum sp. SAR 10_75]KAI8206166.1 hypothetical protein KHU50_000642 [Colletotrichum sp. SAR 10_65]KAI8230893.1 hypothetical protein K4K54_000405 [Colletotrichum sp. SAR 10_86]KAI8254068.1 hypothetical protein K4K53_009448 [Colletotrichum sp. SAR 10_77]